MIHQKKEVLLSDKVTSPDFSSLHVWVRYRFPFILLLSTVLLYINTLNGDFTYDDVVVVLDNPQIKQWHFWDLWQVLGRSTRTLTLMIDYHFFGNSPSGYHIQNILWHLFSVLLLYALVIRLSKDKSLSFLCALLFAVHPIHVEAVANISNRKEMICMVFSLLSFILYLLFIEQANRKKWFWLIGSLVSWYLALNSKEVAIIFPVSLVAYEYIFLHKDKWFLVKKPLLLVFMLVVGGFLLSFYLTSVLYFRRLDHIVTLSGFSGELTFFSVVISSAQSFCTYIKLLFLPINLSPEYIVELSTSLLEPISFLTWFLTILVFMLPFFFIRREPLISFGIFWFLIHYFPVSNLIPSVHLVADRYMYIPSAGFCLILAAISKNFYNVLKENYSRTLLAKVFAATMIVVIACYSIRTVSYNIVWANSVNLWEHTIKATPKAYIAYNNLGYAYKKKGNIEKAIKFFSLGIQLNDDYKAYKSRGDIYKQLGDLEKALEDFNKAINFNPQPDLWDYYDRGRVHEQLGNYNRAIMDFKQVVEFNSQFAEAYYVLGHAYGKLGNHGQAINNFTKFIQFNSQFAEAYYNRALAYSKSGDYQQAIKDYNMAINLNPRYALAYNNRGNMYYILDQYEMAIKSYKKTIALNPQYSPAYSNMGVVYSKLGNTEQASIYFQNAANLEMGEK